MIKKTSVYIFLGHETGLNHPWEVSPFTYEQDIRQGEISNEAVKGNIMNSGANPIEKNKYFEDANMDALESTSGQILQILETIKNTTPKTSAFDLIIPINLINLIPVNNIPVSTGTRPMIN
jgi:hypothetical protein